MNFKAMLSIRLPFSAKLVFITLLFFSICIPGVAQTPCSGNPSANTVTASSASVCPGSTVALSVVNPYTVTGMYYQWFASTTSSSSGYTSVLSSYSPTLASSSLSISTWYRVVVTCTNSGGSTTLIPTQVVTANASTSFTVNSATVCDGQSATLSATGNGSFDWYASATSTLSLGTGSLFTTAALSTGNYTYFVETTNPCTLNPARSPVNVTVNPSPTVGLNSGTLCAGKNFTLIPNGASTYTFLNGGSVVNPLTSASYSLIGTSSQGCVSSNTAVSSLTVYSLPAVTASVTNAVICSGYSTSLYGGGALSYSWTGGITDNLAFTPGSGNTYTVTGTDANGCQNTAVRSITVNALPLVAANSTTAALCVGNPVSLFGSGANTYLWTGGISNNVPFSPTLSSTYTVTGTDANGCQNTASVSITVHALPLVVANSSTSSVCMGYTATLFGSGAASYVWTGGIINNTGFSPTITASYTVTGTDANGCQNTAMKTITVYTLPVVAANTSSAVICFGNTTMLFGSGANSYSWTGGITNNLAFAPSATNTYTVTGTDLNGCQNTASKTITVNALPIVTASVTNAAFCYGGSTTLYGNGASSYIWTDGVLNNTAFTPTVTTSYTVTGTDANSCQNSAVKTVIVYTLPNVGIVASSSAVCMGNTLSLNGAGANTYTWTGGITNGSVFSPSITNTYSVVGTNTLTGCTSTNNANITVTVNPLPTVTALSSNNGFCIPGGTQLQGAGNASTYTWTGGVTDWVPITLTVTTTFTVTGTIASTGCYNKASITVTVYPRPTVTANVTQSIICQGEPTTFYGAGADVYSWSGNFQVYNNVPAYPQNWSTYFLVGTNTLTGCTSTNLASVSITVNPSPSPTITISSPSVCIGNSVNITASGPYTYTWTGGITNGISFTPTSTSVYTVTATNTITGCTNTVGITRTITVNSLPTVNAMTSATVLCKFDPVILYASGSGATSYTWSGGVTNGVTFTPSASATYTLVGLNSVTGCSNTSTVSILVNPLPVITASASATQLCLGNSVVFYGQGADTYVWTNGISNGVSFTPSVSNVYSVTGTNTLTGCSASNSQALTVNPLPSVSSSVSAQQICAGSTILLTGIGANTYTWSGGAVNGLPFSPTTTASYSVSGTNTITGCTSTNVSVQSITVHSLPTLTITTSKLTICSGDSAYLVSSGAQSYIWNNGQTTFSVNVSPSVTTVYSVSGTDQNGCSNTGTISQGVNDCTGISENKKESFFSVYPNPNEGTFTISGDSPLVLTIFNELGEPVKYVLLNESQQNSIIISDLQNGIYFITAQKDGGYFRKKVIVNK